MQMHQLRALGYVDCAFELLEQAKTQKLSIGQVVLATGSADRDVRLWDADIPQANVNCRQDPARIAGSRRQR